MRSYFSYLASILAVICAALVTPERADACGGFFCQNVPVDQSGEHLLFGIEEDGTVVAHIQIQYQGAAEDFAWVLPLPAVPTVSVGSDEIFRTLRALTDPVIYAQRTNSCGGGDGDADADSDSDGGEGEGEGEGEVEVLQRGPVGPYDSAVVSSDDSAALMAWLTDNDYDIPATAGPAVESYVNDDFVFLALRLQNDRSVGDLQPIVVQFPEQGPCVPLRLTAIAASPDMPIYAWVLADGRAVSTNYLDVEPNWLAIDWLRGARNYADVARRAIDEATGHALITELAGDSALLTDAFYWDGRYDTQALRDIADPVRFFQAMIAQGFQASSELLTLLRRYIPKPKSLADVDETDFYNCLECFAEELQDLPFDAEGFADALEATIVQPLRDAQALADRHTYLTRLYTAISPDEMTEDPIFRFNLDLGDVSNVHVAQVEELCDQRDDDGAYTYRVTMPDGRVAFVAPDDPGHPRYAGDVVPEDMPASSRASQQSESGPGDPLYDNSEDIDAIVDRDYGPPPPDGSDDGDGRGHDEADGRVAHSAHGGSCAATPSHGRGAPAMLALVLLALAAAIRRR